jgi:nitrite reductase/ring-hydroxylating ferredoxin subunit
VLDLGQIPDLSKVGSACAVVDAGRKVNLIVARAGSHRYVALDRSCTHGGAQCAYVHSRRRLRCTSLNHAEFELDGTLLHGRTHGNLRAYSVRLDGARLHIALESPWQGRRGASGAEALLHASGNTVNRVLPERPA